jgi:hypothetical protein
MSKEHSDQITDGGNTQATGGGSEGEQQEIDPERLQAELAQIKDAMGLEERYPSRFTLWLVFGVCVLLASLGSQAIALQGLPPSLHSVVWFGAIAAGGVYQGWSQRETNTSSPHSSQAKPRLWFQFAAVFAVYFVAVFSLTSLTEIQPDTLESLIFSLTVALVGVAYLVVGESLRAYYIRRRDRWAFYVGGAWMILLAIIIPNFELLETWGYTAFGVLYAAHAVASYVALSS